MMIHYKRLLIAFLSIACGATNTHASKWFPKEKGKYIKLKTNAWTKMPIEIGPFVTGYMIFKDRNGIWKIHPVDNKFKYFRYDRTASEEETMFIETYLFIHKDNIDAAPIKPQKKIDKYLIPHPAKYTPEEHSVKLFKAIAQDDLAGVEKVISDAEVDLDPIPFANFITNQNSDKKTVLQVINESELATNKDGIINAIKNAANAYLPSDDEYGNLYAYFIDLK